MVWPGGPVLKICSDGLVVHANHRGAGPGVQEDRQNVTLWPGDGLVSRAHQQEHQAGSSARLVQAHQAGRLPASGGSWSLPAGPPAHLPPVRRPGLSSGESGTGSVQKSFAGKKTAMYWRRSGRGWRGFGLAGPAFCIKKSSLHAPMPAQEKHIDTFFLFFLGLR